MQPFKTVDIAFGRGHLTVGLPEEAEVTVIRKATLPKLADQDGAVRPPSRTPWIRRRSRSWPRAGAAPAS